MGLPIEAILFSFRSKRFERKVNKRHERLEKRLDDILAKLDEKAAKGKGGGDGK